MSNIKRISYNKGIEDRNIMDLVSSQILPDANVEEADILDIAVKPYSAPYNKDVRYCSEKKSAFLIGVAGGTSSGKTSVCEAIVKKVKESDKFGETSRIVTISQESFYRELTPEEHEKADNGLFNFDHPDAIDFDLMLSSLSNIKEGIPTEIPAYDLKKQARVRDSYLVIEPSNVVLLEGILVFYRKEILNMFDMKLYVDDDADTRLSKRIQIEMEDRGRSLDHVLHQYTHLVKPSFQEFCVPTKKYADVIIPRGAENDIAITVISQRIIDVLESMKKCKYKLIVPI